MLQCTYEPEYKNTAVKMMDQNQQIKNTSENKVQINAWGLHNPEFPEQIRKA